MGLEYGTGIWDWNLEWPIHGQIVSGTPQVTLREEKWCQFSGVTLKEEGNVRWTESHGTGDDRRTVTYRNHETYVDLTVVVWGDRNTPQPSKLDAGVYSFPFQFTFPPECPPTFNATHRSIKYSLSAFLSSQVNQYKIETLITVGSVVDLNLHPNVLEPVDLISQKDVKKFCCLSAGLAEISMKTPRTGYCVSNDRIPVTIDCTNGSSRQVVLRVEVAQTFLYRAHAHTKLVVTLLQAFLYKWSHRAQSQSKSNLNQNMTSRIYLYHQ